MIKLSNLDFYVVDFKEVSDTDLCRHIDICLEVGLNSDEARRELVSRMKAPTRR